MALSLETEGFNLQSHLLENKTSFLGIKKRKNNNSQE